MATVTSQLTRINDLEGSPSFSSIGGGAGATANTDIFLQGAQSGARRQSNVTLGGFFVDDTVNNDLSGADIHVGMWVFHTHYAVLTALQVWLGTTTANYDQHIFNLNEYPALGGWIRIWVDVSRTPDAVGGTGLNEAQARYFGIVNSLPSVGGNAQNLVVDAIDHTTTGLLLTGTTGLWSDFSSSDANTTNQYGVIRSVNGIYFVYARLTLGSASSLSFNDSNFVIIFPNQGLVATNFMGVSIDLQNASTSITWSSGVIRSAGAKQGDLIVTNNSGSLSASGMALGNLRQITLTSSCTLADSSITGCDKLNQVGSTISNCSVSGSTTADGEAFIISDAPDLISDGTFVFSDGHAIEITTPGTYTFSGNVFTGFGAIGSNDAAIYNNSGGLVTLNITNGGDTPTYRNGSGASTVINNNVTVTITGLRDNTEIRIYAAGTRTELAGTESATTGSVDNRSFDFSIAASTDIDIRIFNVNYNPVYIFDFTVPTSSTSIPITQVIDRSYDNPV